MRRRGFRPPKIGVGKLGGRSPAPVRGPVVRSGVIPSWFGWVSQVRALMKASPPVVRLPYRRGSVEFSVGSEADHEAVFQNLLHVFHGPDREAFLGALSDPSYRPDQRLLVKVENRVVSHVHLTERTVRYGSVTLPMNGVMWVGTLPEYRGMGFAQNLMRLADSRARETGCLVQAL